MARSFVPNQAGFRELAVSPQIRRALAEVAEKGKTFAESIAPFDPADDGDHYRDSFHIRETTAEVAGTRRAAVELVNTSGHAAAVEYGYGGRSGAPGGHPHRVLGRTLEFLESDGRA